MEQDEVELARFRRIEKADIAERRKAGGQRAGAGVDESTFTCEVLSVSRIRIWSGV